MPKQYSLTVVNDSLFCGDVCVFHRDFGMNDPNIMSLAWLTYHLHPTTCVTFTWTLDYAFTWSRTGGLKPGVVCDAMQVLDADLKLANQVTLTYDEDDNCFSFIDKQQNKDGQGALCIDQDTLIPAEMASVGVALSGKGIFAIQARPNWHFMFKPNPNYWLVFGSYKESQALDLVSISRSHCVRFPNNINAMKAVLAIDNTWTIEPVR